MRMSVTPQLSTKNGVANQNARMTNALLESGKTGNKAVIRPGLSQVLNYAGVGAGLVPFRGVLLSIFDDVIYADSSPPAFGSTISPDVAFNLVSINWAVGTTYAMGDSVWYNGQMWFSLVSSNTGNTPAVGAYWVKSFPPAWNSGYTYPAGAEVHYGGYYWFSVVAGNINNTPAEGAYWTSPNPPPKASGGTITYDGAYSIHTFIASGTFTVNTAPLAVDYLIVGGGGGRLAGGGGGGGLSYVTGHVIVSAGAILVTVGTGGISGFGVTNGGSTTFITTVTGGGAGGNNSQADTAPGANGGCGGGGGWPVNGTTSSGGIGSTGFNGGGGASSADGLLLGGGGGGGMGAIGTNGSSVTGIGGNGGNGIQNSISGAAVWYAGGGAGSGDGGPGGNTNGQGQSGPGGGGGDTGTFVPARNGIVIIRYLT